MDSLQCMVIFILVKLICILQSLICMLREVMAFYACYFHSLKLICMLQIDFAMLGVVSFIHFALLE